MKIEKIDLTLFDENYVINTTGSAGLSAEMKTYYDMTLIDEASPNLVHAQFGQKRPIPANGGKTIEFRKFSGLPKATKPLTEGVTPEGKSLSVSTITANVSQYGDYVKQSDVLELTALDNTILEATKLLGKQAGMTLDTVVRDVLAATESRAYASTWSGTTEVVSDERTDLNSTAIIKLKDIEKAATFLRNNNAPTINGSYVAIIHPSVAYDLKADPRFEEWHKYAQPSELYEGEIGKIAGVRFVETTEAKIFAPAEIAGGINRFTCKTAISSSTTTVTVNEAFVETITLDTAADVYVNGTANTVTKITKNGSTYTITLGTAISSLSVGDMICGTGAGKKGEAVFGTLVLADNAYGTTEVTGGGLQTIVKQKGYGDDPLDQRSSIGWKAILTAEILVPQYMEIIESCSSYDLYADAN